MYSVHTHAHFTKSCHILKMKYLILSIKKKITFLMHGAHIFSVKSLSLHQWTVIEKEKRLKAEGWHIFFALGSSPKSLWQGQGLSLTVPHYRLNDLHNMPRMCKCRKISAKSSTTTFAAGLICGILSLLVLILFGKCLLSDHKDMSIYLQSTALLQNSSSDDNWFHLILYYSFLLHIFDKQLTEFYLFVYYLDFSSSGYFLFEFIFLLSS